MNLSQETIEAIDQLTKAIPSGWTLANLGQNDDKTWHCEMREGYLTAYGRVVMADTGSHKIPAWTPSDAIHQCIVQIRGFL